MSSRRPRKPSEKDACSRAGLVEIIWAEAGYAFFARLNPRVRKMISTFKNET